MSHMIHDRGSYSAGIRGTHRSTAGAAPPLTLPLPSPPPPLAPPPPAAAAAAPEAEAAALSIPVMGHQWVLAQTSIAFTPFLLFLSVTGFSQGFFELIKDFDFFSSLV